MSVVERCWAADPKKRPSFDSIVHDIKKKNKYTDSPAVKPKAELYDDGRAMRNSPKLTPQKMQNLGFAVEVPSTGSSPASSPPPVTYATLSPGTIPVQRIITPIREEDRSVASSPVVDRKTFDVPGRSPPPSESFASPHMGFDAGEKEKSQPPSRGASESSASNSTRTTSTDVKTTDSSADVHEPGLELQRFDSPPPADEIAAQRKNERRYRLCLHHDFNPSRELSSKSAFLTTFFSFPCANSQTAVVGAVACRAWCSGVPVEAEWLVRHALQLVQPAEVVRGQVRGHAVAVWVWVCLEGQSADHAAERGSAGPGRHPGSALVPKSVVW